MENNNELDSWDEFTGSNFLKAIDVSSEEEQFVCSKVEMFTDDSNQKKPRIELESDGKTWTFDLNKTNSKKIDELGVKSPRALIGKIIQFRKVLVRNPKTNQEVDGLRISKIV